MATERLVIVVTEKGAKKVETALARIGLVAAKASKDVAVFNKELKGTRAPARRAGGAVKRTGAEIEKAGKKTKIAKTQLSDFKKGLAALGLGLVTRQLIKFSDAATTLTNRLRVVTDTQAQLVNIQSALFDVSQQTRSSLQGNTELFVRLSLASRELGVNQKQLIQFTRSVNQAIKLSGATAQEASAGLIQFSQGISSGALRGDELRSVLEQLPVIADVIAKQLGITRGELREFGKEGGITAKVILEAFKSSREELEKNFAETIPTISESFVQLTNSVIVLVGSLNELTGASGAVASGIKSIADAVTTTATAIDAISTQNIIRIFNLVLFSRKELIQREARLLELIEASKRETRLRTKALNEEKEAFLERTRAGVVSNTQLQAEVDLRTKLKELLLSTAAPDSTTVFGNVGNTPLGRLTPEETPEFSDFDQELLNFENELLRIGDSIQTNFGKTIDVIKADFERVELGEFAQGMEAAFKRVDTSVKGLAETIGNLLVGAIDNASIALADFAVTGLQDTESLKAAFSDLFQTLARDILAATIRLIIMQSLFGSSGLGGGPGGSTGGLVGLFTNQIGGPLQGGDTSIVGERGPELFTAPPGGGRITRNEDLGGGGATMVKIVNILPGQDTGDAFSSEEGEELIINTIQKRSSEVREILN